MALTVTVESAVIDGETVQIATVAQNGTTLKFTFSYPATMTEADIQADVLAKLAERGYT